MVKIFLLYSDIMWPFSLEETGTYEYIRKRHMMTYFLTGTDVGIETQVTDTVYVDTKD